MCSGVVGLGDMEYRIQEQTVLAHEPHSCPASPVPVSLPHERLGFSSLVEYLPSMREALCSCLSTTKKENEIEKQVSEFEEHSVAS